jgi:hypothetical protein
LSLEFDGVGAIQKLTAVASNYYTMPPFSPHLSRRPAVSEELVMIDNVPAWSKANFCGDCSPGVG